MDKVGPEEPVVAASAKREPTRASGVESFQSLLVTIILALFATCFVVQAFKIPSQSMEPTLLVGDHLLVNKFIFEGRGNWYDRFLPYREIHRGDIIVFKFPYQDHTHYVKRVIGVPGDRVKIVNEKVYVNDGRLNEPYVVHDPTAFDPYGANFPPADLYLLQSAAVLPQWAAMIPSYIKSGELVVPPGNYFVMGDNRDHSWDSRYWGFVRRNAIMGRPVVIYWSVHAPGNQTAATGIVDRLVGVADALAHLPVDTRWNRMFREVH
jgi:signal peptidase I